MNLLSPSALFLAAFMSITLLDVPTVESHGLMSFPNPRGCLTTKKIGIYNSVNEKTKPDYRAHFPSGSKDMKNGSGHRSQIEAYKGKPWKPFDPRNPFFKWRVGVCGDLREGPTKNDHLRGGKFYNGGQIAATFEQGGIIDVTMSINFHHNGFMELYVCDVKHCGGEINELCFRRKKCYPLQRAPNPTCDSGLSKKCGPIDTKYPGRWYFPCKNGATRRGNILFYGKGTALYKLPNFLHCQHCVLHWYWTSANNCTPPGVRNYFTGKNRPRNWGNCRGQGSSIGGLTNNAACGKKFPEEYNLCSDIRIKKKQPNNFKKSGSTNGNKKSIGNGGSKFTSTDNISTVKPSTTKPSSSEPSATNPSSTTPSSTKQAAHNPPSSKQAPVAVSTKMFSNTNDR